MEMSSDATSVKCKECGTEWQLGPQEEQEQPEPVELSRPGPQDPPEMYTKTTDHGNSELYS